MRNLKKTLDKFHSKEFEIYFHQDLDGVTTAVSIIEILKRYNFKCKDAHFIQYGEREYCIPNVKEGRMAVLCDFAHSKDMFDIVTDHHLEQKGVDKKKSNLFSHAPSNAEVINRNSKYDLFYPTDLNTISTVDSANYYNNRIKIERVVNPIFKIKDNRTVEYNRTNIGLVCNKLTLSYKNSTISGKINGKTYMDKNFMEVLVLESTPSMYNIYNNIKYFVKNFCDRSRTNLLDLPRHILTNRLKYKEKMKPNVFNGIEIQRKGKLNFCIQKNCAENYSTGSYDRYVPFENSPNISYHTVAWDLGLVQISRNPFKPRKYDISLGEVKDDILLELRESLSNAKVPILKIKEINELGINKLHKKGERIKNIIGYNYNDLIAFYGDSIDFELNDIQKNIFNKPFKKINNYEKEILKDYKVSLYNIIERNSGGHTDITNLSGLTYFDMVIDGKKQLLKDLILPIDAGYKQFMDKLQKMAIEKVSNAINI